MKKIIYFSFIILIHACNSGNNPEKSLKPAPIKELNETKKNDTLKINVEDITGEWYSYDFFGERNFEMIDDKWFGLDINVSPQILGDDSIAMVYYEYPAPFAHTVFYKNSECKNIITLYYYSTRGQNSQTEGLMALDSICFGTKIAELRIINQDLLELKFIDDEKCGWHTNSFCYLVKKSSSEEFATDDSFVKRYHDLIQPYKLLINLLKIHGVSLSLYNNNLIDIKDTKTVNDIIFSKTTNEKITGIVYDFSNTNTIVDHGVDQLDYNCYINGKLNGISFWGVYCEIWFIGDSTNVYCERSVIETYSDGLKNGIHTDEWYDYYNFKGLYIDGKPDGLHEHWGIQSDNKFKEVYYNKGVIVKQNCWDEHGYHVECE